MRLIAIAFVALLIVACGWNAATMNPESPQYPCGTRGVVCSGSYPHASCCWIGDVCGGVDPSCPIGQCCFVGDDGSELGVSRAHTRMRPQHP